MVDQVLAVAVVLLPTLFAVGIEMVSKEIKEHLYWRIVVLTFGVGLSVLTWFQMSRANKAASIDRGNAIVETSEKVSAKVSESVSKSVTKSVSDQYTQTINSLQLQIGSLQGQLAVQGKNVDAIKGSNIVTGKLPIRVELANPGVLPSGEAPPKIVVSAMPADARPQIGKHARQLILTTNKVMNGAYVSIICEHKINQGMVWVSGTGGMTGRWGMVGDKKFDVGITSPNWAPDFPLVVTLYFDDEIEPCTIQTH